LYFTQKTKSKFPTVHSRWIEFMDWNN